MLVSVKSCLEARDNVTVIYIFCQNLFFNLGANQIILFESCGDLSQRCVASAASASIK